MSSSIVQKSDDPSGSYKLSPKGNRAYFYDFVRGQAGASLSVLFTIPLSYALMCYIILGKNPTDYDLQAVRILGYLCIPALIATLIHYIWQVRQHLNYARSIKLTDQGLIFSSLGEKKVINNHDIKDVYETASGTNIIQTNSGNLFFSTDMERAPELLSKLQNRIGIKPKYDYSIWRTTDYQARSITACVAVYYAFNFPTIKALALDHLKPLAHRPDLAMSLAMIIGSTILLIIAVRFFVQKIPRGVRLSPEGIELTDSNGPSTYYWQQIKIKKNRAGPIIITPNGWYWAMFVAYFPHLLRTNKAERMKQKQSAEVFYEKSTPRLLSSQGN